MTQVHLLDARRVLCFCLTFKAWSVAHGFELQGMPWMYFDMKSVACLTVLRSLSCKRCWSTIGVKQSQGRLIVSVWRRACVPLKKIWNQFAWGVHVSTGNDWTCSTGRRNWRGKGRWWHFGCLHSRAGSCCSDKQRSARRCSEGHAMVEGLHGSRQGWSKYWDGSGSRDVGTRWLTTSRSRKGLVGSSEASVHVLHGSLMHSGYSYGRSSPQACCRWKERLVRRYRTFLTVSQWRGFLMPLVCHGSSSDQV